MAQNDQDPTRYDLPVQGQEPHEMTLGEGLGLHPDYVEPPPPPRVRRKRNKGLIAAVAAGILVAIVGIVYVVDYLNSKDQIAQGVVIAGVPVGGLTPAEAKVQIETEIGAMYRNPITVTAYGEQVKVSPVDAGLGIDIDSSVAAVGLRGANPIDRIKSFSQTKESSIQIVVNEKKLTAWLKSLAGNADVAAVEGTVTIEGTKVVVVEPVEGEHLDVQKSAELISQAWSTGGPRAVAGMTLPEDTDGGRTTAETVAKTAKKARAILSGPLTVTAADVSTQVPLQVIAQATTITPDQSDGFTITVDPEPIKAAFAEQALGTETDPTDASLAMTAQGPQITESTLGRRVDFEKTMAGLNKALAGKADVLEVVYQDKKPAVSTADIKALGINEVISEFTTYGFAWDSGQNVKRTAEIVDGAMVRAGETFSLNEYTGPRGLAQGFIEAGIIQDGVASRAVGGGISQFATTIYNASYFAGMEDIEHKAHSFYISRYPEGREATVFQNPDGSSVIDVVFKNNSSTAVWIQTIWTDSSITVKFWGTPTVKVESITGERYNYTEPVTKTIPYGQPCNASGGSSGFSVDNTRVISDLAGNEINRETQTTVYNGQQRIICEPPPPEPSLSVDPVTSDAAQTSAEVPAG